MAQRLQVSPWISSLFNVGEGMGDLKSHELIDVLNRCDNMVTRCLSYQAQYIHDCFSFFNSYQINGGLLQRLKQIRFLGKESYAAPRLGIFSLSV